MFGRRRPEERPARSLRWAWGSTLVMFGAVFLAVIVTAVIAVQYQHDVLVQSTDGVEQETEALVALDRSLLEAVGDMTVVLYRTAPEESLADARAEYEQTRLDVAAAFDRVDAAVHSEAERALVAEARDHWGRIDAAVLASEAEYTDEELATRLARNEDPFVGSVWTPYDDLDLTLADLRSETVRDFQSRLDDAGRLREILLPAFALTVVLAISITVVTVRRMSREVLRPLAEVDRAAREMRDTDQPVSIDVGGAVREVNRLAETLSETSRSLFTSRELLETQAHTDALTMLPNRKGFSDELHEMLDDPADRPVTVLFIDVDDFKDVNDSMGHAAGDELLQIVGLRLQSAARADDLVSRLGGDEFAVAAHLEGRAGEPIALEFAQRVLDALRHPVKVADTSLQVTCSIGIATSESDMRSVDAERLLANADFAMYVAKSKGKNRHELHSATLHSEMIDRMELRRDLAEAAPGEQLELHYQPAIDLENGDLVGFEALVRWRHPTRGLLSPAAFIDIAEESGTIIDIGAWVLDRACATLAELHRDDPDLVMSVNVSPRQLAQPDFARTVINAFLTRGVPPNRLVLEITEAMAMTKAHEGIAQLERLRDHGVHIALDDFGTGFSSLRYLGDLPADVIKIDRSFVMGRGVNESSTLDSIITLAQRLGLRIVAEGIETQEDLERLRGYGRIAGQGYLLARPMPFEELDRYRREHHSATVPPWSAQPAR